MKITENEIPALIKKGNDKNVITELYKIVFPKVKGYIVRHNGIEDDAFDVFQDSILYFYKQIIEDTYNEKYTVYGYLYRLSVNRWLNKLKKDKRLKLSDDQDLDDFEEPPENGFKEISILNKNENLIEKLFSGIGEKCVQLLSYTIYNNLMIEDITLRMGFNSDGATKMKLKRCKEKLYREVEKNPVLLNKIKGL